MSKPDDSSFPQKRKRPGKTWGITWLNALLLATGISSLMNECAPTIEERRKWFSDRQLLLCFVIRYPYQITLCVYRPREFAEKPNQGEMMTADEVSLSKAARGRVRTTKNLAVAGEIE
jgi:hypothetical protein